MEESQAGDLEVIDVSRLKPKKVPSKKWRQLIHKVWEVDPLVCPKCSGPMRIVALIDDDSEVKRTLKSLGISYDSPQPKGPSRSPPDPQVHELFLDLSESQVPPDLGFLN